MYIYILNSAVMYMVDKKIREWEVISSNWSCGCFFKYPHCFNLFLFLVISDDLNLHHVGIPRLYNNILLNNIRAIMVKLNVSHWLELPTGNHAISPFRDRDKYVLESFSTH